MRRSGLLKLIIKSAQVEEGGGGRALRWGGVGGLTRTASGRRTDAPAHGAGAAEWGGGVTRTVPGPGRWSESHGAGAAPPE